MKLLKKVGFIGGGQMGEALINGILNAKLLKGDQIEVMEPEPERRRYLESTFGIVVYDSGKTVWTNCEIVIFAVKPQIIADVLQNNLPFITKKHLIVSIAAGIPLSFLENTTANQFRFIRVMPNTPALIQEAATAISCGSLATSEDISDVETIFNAVGKTVVLEEKFLDAVTGLSGSGPAYVFSFIEAMIDAGLKVGLSRPVAEVLVLQTILGATKMVEKGSEHPAQLRSMVTSPGGTTIAGLHILETAGFRGIIMNAVEAAVKRSGDLGK